MELTSDGVVLGAWGPLHLNLTIVATWAVMGLLIGGAWWARRHLHEGPRIPAWQHALEAFVATLREQITEVGGRPALGLLPFIGTLFLFIAAANILAVVPGFPPPTASLSTTTALALCVAVAVPLYGIRRCGPGTYLRGYLRPSPFMLPFNLLGEVSRTLALAVRLFGNALSGVKIAAVLLLVVPLVLPTAMQALGLLTGLIQAYIFAILALVYIAAAAVAAHAPTSPGAPSCSTPP